MRWQRALGWATALVLIGAAAGGAGMGMSGLPRTGPPEPRRATAAAVADQDRYRASFPNGATVEVIAISTVPTGPHTWWKPDGSPLAEAPADAIEPRFRDRERDAARVILVRTSGVHRGDMFRWNPTRARKYWGGRPTRGGRPAPELDDYIAMFGPEQADCGIRVRVASGPWKTEASNEGRGGTGFFVNGHKFDFGKARAYQAHGQSLTAMGVAHNFFGQDRRLVAVDRDGETHTAVWSSGSDGDPSHVVDLIDAEFPVPPDRIREFQVQFRPYEEAEIRGIALDPRPGAATPAQPGAEDRREARPQ